jgi:hypothetical protein
LCIPRAAGASAVPQIKRQVLRTSPSRDDVLKTKAVGLLGAVRFLTGFYLVFVKRRASVGAIGNHMFYTIRVSPGACRVGTPAPLRRPLCALPIRVTASADV